MGKRSQSSKIESTAPNLLQFSIHERIRAMRFIPDITWHGAPIHGAALAIGIFDGVHKGHQAILNEGIKAGLPDFDPRLRQYGKKVA